MLTRPHHFGITVAENERSTAFYTRALRLPRFGASDNRGVAHDAMYHLGDTVNRVTWYQIGPHGAETFYLPSHAPQRVHTSDLECPGYRYAAFSVRNLPDFISRLKQKHINVIEAETPAGPCARIIDPDQVNILLFPEPAKNKRAIDRRPGAIVALREAGIVVADPAPYPEFFNAIGLHSSDDSPPGFIKPLFDYDKPVSSMLFDCFRILSLPNASSLPRGASLFPFNPETNPDETLDYYPDPGIKHLCYAVDNLAVFRKQAERSGVYFLAPNLPLPGGSVMCYFSDPEGNVLEAFQMPPVLSRLASAASLLYRSQLDLVSMLRRALP